jgi:hypothetical protein
MSPSALLSTPTLALNGLLATAAPDGMVTESGMQNGNGINADGIQGNPPGAPWIVQKFGGTSLGKFADQIAVEIVK